MPSPNKIALKAYLTPEEYEDVKATASQTRLSISQFVRAVCLGYEPKSKVEHEAVLVLLQTNRDLSRLGNLLKLTLDQSTVDDEKVYELLDSIQNTKSLLNEKVKAI